MRFLLVALYAIYCLISSAHQKAAAENLHSWWEDQFIVEEDLSQLQFGDNLLLAFVGNRSYLEHATAAILHNYKVDPCSVIVANVTEEYASDTIVRKLQRQQQLHKFSRQLVVLSGGEQLKNTELSYLDVLFSIPDRTFGLSNTIGILNWDITKDSEFSNYRNIACGSEVCVDDDIKSRWSDYFIHRLQTRNSRAVNGAAIVGRIRRIGFQNHSHMVPEDSSIPLINVIQKNCDDTASTSSNFWYATAFLCISTVYFYVQRSRHHSTGNKPTDLFSISNEKKATEQISIVATHPSNSLYSTDTKDTKESTVSDDPSQSSSLANTGCSSTTTTTMGGVAATDNNNYQTSSIKPVPTRRSSRHLSTTSMRP